MKPRREHVRLLSPHLAIDGKGGSFPCVELIRKASLYHCITRLKGRVRHSHDAIQYSAMGSALSDPHTPAPGISTSRRHFASSVRPPRDPVPKQGPALYAFERAMGCQGSVRVLRYMLLLLLQPSSPHLALMTSLISFRSTREKRHSAKSCSTSSSLLSSATRRVAGCSV